MAIDFGLTTAGFVTPRSADWLEIIRDEFEAEVGVEVDWSRQTVLGPWSLVIARRLGSLSETVAALRDSRSVNNATGAQLDDLAQLSLTEREGATRSEVNLTLTSTAAIAAPVFIEEASLFSGGGEDGRARWRTLEAVFVPATGGNVVVAAEAVDEGAVAAAIGEITKILSPVEGLASCTNAAAAVLGKDDESHASLRRRIPEAPYRAGRGGPKSLRERVRELASIETCSVLENDSGSEATISGYVMEAHSVAVFVHPDTITTEEQEELASVLFDAKATGIKMLGTEEAEITVADVVITVRWNYATTVAYTLAFDVGLFEGFALADVETALQELGADYFSDLVPGDDLLMLDVAHRAKQNVPGIKSLVVKFNGAAADVTITATQLATLNGTPTVTIV